MKRLTFILVLVISIFINGCKKDDSPNDSNNSISATYYLTSRKQLLFAVYTSDGKVSNIQPSDTIVSYNFYNYSYSFLSVDSLIFQDNLTGLSYIHSRNPLGGTQPIVSCYKFNYGINNDTINVQPDRNSSLTIIDLQEALNIKTLLLGQDDAEIKDYLLQKFVPKDGNYILTLYGICISKLNSNFTTTQNKIDVTNQVKYLTEGERLYIMKYELVFHKK